MSGFGHPIIGFDHLAFIIASGLLAAKIGRGIFIPIVFTIATALGAIIHLQAIDLPIPEIVIAASVVVFGSLLVKGKQRNQSPNYYAMVVGLAALAGIFHGHAYGEGIFGAETTPLMAYLLGFTMIQMVISLGIYALATQAMKTTSVKTITRFAGLAITAIGMVFLTSAITG
jgi:urease accessory protein